MQKLLSLPPNLIHCFHELEEVNHTDWFCTSDPIGSKLGSGGGTTWLLQACHQAFAPQKSFGNWIGDEKRILLHAGGQSRRLPSYGPSGKILTPIPIFSWERGQKLGQNLLSLQLPLYERIMNQAPAGLNTLIASGDVYIRSEKPLQDIPNADVVCYGLWVNPSLATHHGVFASVYGSILLQTPEERSLIKGIIINKFRGDIRLFESGIKMIEDLCKVPVLGVVPYYKGIYIEEEDSVMLESKNREAIAGKINIAVILLRHLSNFTDFNVLERDERVHLYYTNNVNEIAKADIVLLPGSKNTLDDLYELRCNGVVQAILKAHREGATIMGICGGYQMMGLEVRDPDGVEGSFKLLPGLGLLPVITTMQGDKVTRQVNFTFDESDTVCKGYEIHMGRSVPAGGFSPSPLNKLEDGREDGYRNGRKCMGTYIHGILDNQSFIDFLLKPYADKLEQQTFDYATFKEEQYDKLAEHVRKHINMPLLYKILERND